MSTAVKHADDCNCRTCKLRRNEPTIETCDSCGKKRLCIKVSTDKLTNKIEAWSPDYCVKECLNLTGPQRAAKREERKQARKERAPALAYPIAGGPLDGLYAVPADFYEESGKPGDTWYRAPGRYADHRRAYDEFNAGRGGNRRIGGAPTMIFVHVSLQRPLVRGADRFKEAT